MKYCIALHTRWGHPMGTIYWNNKKKLIEEAQWHMEWLTKACIRKHYLQLNKG